MHLPQVCPLEGFPERVFSCPKGVQMRVFSALARGIKAAFRAVLNTLRSVNADAVHDFMASARVGSVDVTVHAGATLTPRGALRVAVNVVAESSIVQNVTALASKAMPAFNPL